MTHILIPITEHLEEAIRTGNVEYLSELVFRGKQISLDEKDIEEKAAAFAKTGVVSGKFGYKQALKDLL